MGKARAAKPYLDSAVWRQVHLLIQAQPRFSVAQIMGTLKGGTSRVLRQAFPELEDFLWGDSFWADGY